MELYWQSSGEDSALPLKGLQVQSLVGELKILHAMWLSKNFLKKDLK